MSWQNTSFSYTEEKKNLKLLKPLKYYLQEMQCIGLNVFLMLLIDDVKHIQISDYNCVILPNLSAGFSGNYLH